MKNNLFILFVLILLIPSSSFSADKQYYFVFLNTNPNREKLSEEETMKLQEGHLNNINRLAKEGKLITAGPVKGGGGIFILIASSMDEANEYLQTDPAIKANRFNLEVYPMNIAEGNLCKVDSDDFEMVSYTLTRYKGDFVSKDKSKLLIQIEFEDINEGIAVFNYDLEKGNMEELNDYFLADENIYTKTLWIGRGSFCE